MHLVDIGDSGRHSDGGVFSNSKIRKLFNLYRIDLPKPSTLPGSSILAPYVLVGDDAFPLKHYLMKPFPGRLLADDANLFNYRLCRARRCMENAFGILAVRWQIFYGMLQCGPDLAERIVKAAIVLHNFLQREQSDLGNICSPDGEITAGLWRQTVPSTINFCRTASGDTVATGSGCNFGSNNARLIRFSLCNYFNTIGSADWQWSINK